MDRLSIFNKCTQSGHQLTPQRQIIIDEFIKKKSGFTAYELLEIINLNDKSLNISTIYRILDFRCVSNCFSNSRESSEDIHQIWTKFVEISKSYDRNKCALFSLKEVL